MKSILTKRKRKKKKKKKKKKKRKWKGRRRTGKTVFVADLARPRRRR